MWQLLLVLSTLISPSFAEVPATSVGPTSDEEAKILWENGKAAFEHSRFDEAALALRRLIDRYPGYPGYLDAHLYLGRSELELGNPKNALGPIQYYVLGIGKKASPAAVSEGKLWLGRTYLKLGRNNEAYLTSLEIEKSRPKSEIQAEALLVRTNALIGLGQDIRAEKVLSSAKTLLSPTSRPVARAEATFLDLRLKTRACGRLNATGPMDEDQIRDLLERRGTCLIEAMLHFKKTLETGNKAISLEAGTEIEQAFNDYGRACSQPPNPPQKMRKKRTEKQLERYRTELAALLERECMKKRLSSADLLNEWKSALPPQTAEIAANISARLGSNK